MRPALVWLFCAAALLGCPRDKLAQKACQIDADCPSPAGAYRCEPQTGLCYCKTDAACPPAQLCNAVGFCQDRSGCEKNADCLDAALYCDTTTGGCVPYGRCSLDLQCELGQICDTGRGLCVAGCRTSGDCQGTSCRCGDAACTCAGTTPAEVQACQVGVCDPNFCADESFCRYGEICGIPPDSGVTRASCYSDYDTNTRPYCDRCTSGAGLDTCGVGPNFCIIDTRNQTTYCGSDCGDGQSCPRGYQCRDIIVVFTRWQCSATRACPPDPNLPCGTDADCKRGGTCIKPTGSASGTCAGACRVREGSSFGYCSCQVNEDCAQEACSAGECTISRRRCVTEADCRPIRCVDFNGVGGCLIGQNCTPANGLTCVEVQ